MRFFALLLICLTTSFLKAQQWISAEGNFGNDRIDDITFVNQELGYAVSGDGRIFKTIDGGVNWSMIQYFGDSNYLRAVEFLDEQTGFVTRLDGGFLKTTDGGENWTDIASKIPGPSTSFCGLEHYGDTIWSVGVFAYPSTLIRSLDRGESWEVSRLDSLADGLVEVYFPNGNTGFIGGISEAEGAKILRTDDGGNTWKTVFTSDFASEYVWKIYPINSDTIYASIENLFFPKTSIAASYDGGNSWTEKLVDSLLLDIQGIGFIDGLRGWVGPRNNRGFYTEDGGESWVQDLNFPRNINRITTRPDGTLFASGDRIYYYAQDTLISDLENFESPAPNSSISVFPNPVRNTINYEIKIEQPTNYRLDIFASDGKPLANLGSGRLATGLHQSTFEIPTHFPSGSLFLVLRCDDNMMAIEVARFN